MNWRLPFDGRFIGSPFGCSTHANIKDTPGRFHSMRMPTHRGEVTALAFHLRVNKPHEQGYSSDDGGQLVIELRRNMDDGTPDMAGRGLLGQTTVNGGMSDPLTSRSNHQSWTLTHPVPVDDGGTVHFVFRQAAEGAVSHNVAIYWGELDPLAGPYFASGPNPTTGYGLLTTFDGGRTFSTVGEYYGSKHFFWGFEAGYADGIWKGSPGFAGTYQTIKPIGGRWMARQRMVINPSDVTLRALWLRAWWRDARPDDPLLMQLRRADGEIVSEVAIPSDWLGEGRSTKANRKQIPWVKVALPDQIKLRRGDTVDAVLMSEGDYFINAHIDGTKRYGFKTMDSYDCRAQYSIDGGGFFADWDADKLGGRRDDLQLPLAFECVI